MGAKELCQDVEAAHFCRDKRHVLLVERGKLEGEVIVIFSHEHLPHPLQIRVVSKDVTQYPRAGFMLFADPPELVTWAIPVLHGVSNASANTSVLQVTQEISKRLVESVDAHVVATTPRTASCPIFPPFSRRLAEDDQKVEDHVRRLSIEPGCPEPTAPMRLQKLENDLTAVQAAGLFARPLGTATVTPNTIFCVSIPLYHINISADTLHYWNFGSTDHIVLLMKFPNGYPTVSEFCRFEADANAQVLFRIGKCRSRTPSVASAESAFELDDSDNKSGSKPESRQHSFTMMHLLYSIGKQLTTALPQLIWLRRNSKVTWDQAHDILSDMTDGSAPIRIQPPSSERTTDAEPSYFTPESGLSRTVSDNLVFADEAHFNLPLVVMQFTIRRFARCTEFCIVCHSKINNGYESAKPYVCSKDLCQLQLIEFGFGYDLEHEVTNHPYVVDLLINFYLSSARDNAGQAPQVPQGLQLKVPSFGSPRDSMNLCDAAIPARFDFSTGSLSLKFSKGSGIAHMGPGTSLIMISPRPVDVTAAALWTDRSCTTHLCTLIRQEACQSSGMKTFQCKLRQVRPVQAQSGTRITATPSGSTKVGLYLFDTELRKVPKCTLKHAIVFLSELMPSVLDMRDFLVKHRRPLKEWDQLHPSALSLLNWIVATNRSYLVQDQRIVKRNAREEDPTEPPFGPRVHGLGTQWMQFRFIQGSPEKEAKFRAVIASPKFRQTRGQHYPSLFAWHGSPMSNWHNIVREGLNFRKMSHGRAFGNGIYLSPHFCRSLGYAAPSEIVSANAYGEQRVRAEHAWSNSDLCPLRALSICEVVNWPQRFVSRSPHYVVGRTEWVQCRYLLVEVRPTRRAMKHPLPNRNLSECTSYIQQDPNRPLQGPKTHILIPRVDRPKPLAPPVAPQTSAPKGVNLKRPPLAELISSRPEKQRDTRDRELTPARSEEHLLGLTPFTAGSLDKSDLPRMPAPSWAASSPAALSRLNRDIKRLQVIQTQHPLTKLGWYVNFDQLENVFQWIVELHSFPRDLPLAKDMTAKGCESVVLELRFGGSYPNSPPFVRVVQPIFMPFVDGGGGHITLGGAICSELLTSTGWRSDLAIEQVFLTVRTGLCDEKRPAKLSRYSGTRNHYAIKDAAVAFQRACHVHGWTVPEDVKQILKG